MPVKNFNFQLNEKTPAQKLTSLRGAPETIRTSDLVLRRDALYPAELRVRLN